MNDTRRGGIIRPHESRLSLLLRALDGAWIVGSLWLVLNLYGLPWTSRYGMVSGVAVSLFYLFAESRSLYRSWRGSFLQEESFRLWGAWFAAALTLVVLAFATKTSSDYSRFVITAWFFIVPCVLTGWRISLRLVLARLRSFGRNIRSAAIVGANTLGQRFARAIMDAPWMGIRVAGFYDDRLLPGRSVLEPDGLKIEGDLSQLVEGARRGEIDLVYIALPMRDEATATALVERLADTTASVYVIPDFYVFNLLHARWKTVGGFPAVSIYENPFDSLGGWIKRAEDLVLSILLLSITAIPMLLIALGVKLSSPGPVIFKQRRYGINGKPVEVWKFRTMTVCEDGEKQFRQAKREIPG